VKKKNECEMVLGGNCDICRGCGRYFFSAIPPKLSGLPKKGFDSLGVAAN
jgi:hypothetical protein